MCISTSSRDHVASLEKSYFEVINYTYILLHPAPPQGSFLVV